MTEEKESLADKIIVEARNRGKSWQDIEETYNVPADEAYRRYVAYVEKNAMPEAEYRMMQLSRLEAIIDALWDLGIKHGSLDHIKDGILPALQEVSKLLGLNKQKAITEIQVIDQRQQVLVVAYVDAVQETLKRKVIETVPVEARREIEANWDDWVAKASENPLKMIEQDTVRV